MVEWRHIGKDVSNTCERCSETGTNVMSVIREISLFLQDEGISVRFVETKLPAAAVSESNAVLFNGMYLEDLIDGMEVSFTECKSCSCITGEDFVECRAVDYKGERYEAIPPELIIRAALRAVGFEDDPETELIIIEKLNK